MSLNAREVEEILKALEASSFDSLDLEIGGVKLSLRRSGATPAPPRATAPRAYDSAVPTLAAVAEHAAGADDAKHAAGADDAAGTDDAVGINQASAGRAPAVPPGTHAVPAPLLGVFYRAPKPGEPSFVEVGSRVEADTTIGIIEVMKLMNTVRAGVRGEIVAIAARNGELVEFGEPLLFVRPD